VAPQTTNDAKPVKLLLGDAQIVGYLFAFLGRKPDSPRLSAATATASYALKLQALVPPRFVFSSS
jgi:hypothetical protein